MPTKYRFSKQIRKNDCAPNAIINLMKFFGLKISYKHSYKKLYDHFDIPSYNGTHPVDLHMYLVKRKIPKSRLVDVMTNPSLTRVAKRLNKNRAMVVAFHNAPRRNGHVFLLTGVNKNGFQAINYCTKKTVQTIPFDKFQKQVLDFNKALVYIYERK